MKNTVAVIKCETYEEELVYRAVKKASELAGGFGSFLKPGMRVLVKPNLLAAFFPEAAVTTHPAVVKAVIRLVKEFQDVPFLGDCHGGILTGSNELLTKTGMIKCASETKTEIVSLEKLGSDNYGGLVISKAIKEFDVIINVGKFKTHMLTFLTGAVKNLFGLLPGMNKANMHRLYPKQKDFSMMLLKVAGIVKPAFNITDGITGMEGEGPSGGTPRQIGVIIAARDAVASDYIMGKIAGIDPLTLPVIKEAVAQGFNPAEMEVTGGPLEMFTVKDFRMPLSYGGDGGSVKENIFKRILKSVLFPLYWKLATVKPKIQNEKCQKCNACVRACPVEAIAYAFGFPKVKAKKCIECYCCHELCPHRAIALDTGFIVKLWLLVRRTEK